MLSSSLPMSIRGPTSPRYSPPAYLAPHDHVMVQQSPFSGFDFHEAGFRSFRKAAETPLD